MEQAIKIAEGGDASEARDTILDLDRRVKVADDIYIYIYIFMYVYIYIYVCI